LVALALGHVQQALASVQVDQAMTLIRATCTLPNTALEMRPTPEGRLELRITLADGQRRSMALARRDLDSFTDTAAQLMSRLSFDLTGCMEPYLNEAMAGLAGLPDRPTAAAPPPYVPPALPTPVLPALPTPVPPAPGPVAAASAPPRPVLPTTGDLPVAFVNNPGLAASAPAGTAAPVSPNGSFSMRVNGCRAAGRNVVCEVKLSNDTGKDVRVVAQGSYSKLFGEDGTQLQAAWATLGNQQADLRQGSQLYYFTLIADTSPVFNISFHEVPSILTSIKRLEVALGVQTTKGTEMQKVTQADVLIQGR
jgi:hypothetical protein